MIQKQPLYSVRMRASLEGRHISGAERIVSRDRIDEVSSQLRNRALSRLTEPDRIVLTIESLAGRRISEVPALAVTTCSLQDVGLARVQAARILEQAGVDPGVVRSAIDLLDRGAAPRGTVMRGAVIMTAHTGKRLEPDQERGVRVSRVDWSQESSIPADRKLAAAGLGHYRTKEALALATKISRAPGVIAELCWSDDPGYTAGYVASRSQGYVRFPMLKRRGSPMGGRVFFVREADFDIHECIDYLERAPVLISGISGITHEHIDHP